MFRKPSKRRYDGKKLYWFRAARRFALLVLAVYLVFRFVIGISVVSGVSMMNTLGSGEAVIYRRIFKTPTRGDIVSVRRPEGEYVIKRVAAVAGDTVEIKDGVFYLNGEPESGDYFVGETDLENLAIENPYVVPENQVFVLGDNRKESTDSRKYGARDLSEVRGIIGCSIGFWFVHFH